MDWIGKNSIKIKSHFQPYSTYCGNLHPVKTSESDLDAIEYYHSIRNNLYHEPIGITTKVNIVELYFTLADNLIRKIFDIEEKGEEKIKLSDTNEKFKEFLEIWDKIRINLNNYTLTRGLIPQIKEPYTIHKILFILVKNKKISNELAERISTIYELRNQVSHNKLYFYFNGIW